MSNYTRPAASVDALVIFVDARGFTSWAQRVDVFAFIDEFGQSLHDLLRDCFPPPAHFMKGLGDGAMIVREISEVTDIRLLRKLLLDTLKAIDKAERAFSVACRDLSVRYGTQIELALGWGVTKGHVKKIGDDYIGADLNKCSRLCGIARPSGIVIDREDFPVLPRLPKGLDISLYEQKRKLDGIRHGIDVWVTQAIASQFITRENLRESPEVHVAGICLRRDQGTVSALVARRSASRHLFPDLYEGCGGQLARNEYFTSGVRRHFLLELGVEVDVIEHIHRFYFIQQPSSHRIPGIAFLCEYKAGEPHSENHSEVRWVSESELREMPDDQFIPGLKSGFLEFIAQFKGIRKAVRRRSSA